MIREFSAGGVCVRRMREEAGVEGALVEKLGDVRYWYRRDGERVMKNVAFFLFQYRSGSVRDQTTRSIRPSGCRWRTPRGSSPTAASGTWQKPPFQRCVPRGNLTPPVFVLNFYSPVFVDQLNRGRKTATIRLGDKSRKYQKGEVVLITVGFQHSPREKIFEAVIDAVDVKKVNELSPRDVEHDNPEFRRVEETIHFLEQIYGREVSTEDTVTVVRFSAIFERPEGISERMRAAAPTQN